MRNRENEDGDRAECDRAGEQSRFVRVPAVVTDDDDGQHDADVVDVLDEAGQSEPPLDLRDDRRVVSIIDVTEYRHERHGSGEGPDAGKRLEVGRSPIPQSTFRVLAVIPIQRFLIFLISIGSLNISPAIIQIALVWSLVQFLPAGSLRGQFPFLFDFYRGLSIFFDCWITAINNLHF